MKHVMLAVGGETPQIITEAVYALKEQVGIELAEVQVLTTRRGRQVIQQSLLAPDKGQFRELCREYQLSTRFSAEMIHVFTDSSGQLLDDVRTSEENGCVRDQVFDKVRELTEEIDLCLHGCIAGGRKSMSFFLGAAFNFFRRLPREGHPGDRLYHVLVSPSEVERAKDFFFIPREAREYAVLLPDSASGEKEVTFSSADVRIELAELPCISVRSLVHFHEGMDYDHVFGRTQKEIQSIERVSGRSLPPAADIPGLIGESPVMRRVRREIAQYAPLDIPVLIRGDTGTGKELVAQAIHDLSPRVKKRPKPVSINCGALSDTLVQSELFGSVRGAYSEAIDRKGAFREAHGGTLFLDEIGELSAVAQSKLLRVLEEGEVQPLGRDQVEKVDVRLVAATHRDLEEMVENETFRRDLYFRLERCEIVLPALRERRRDIPLLIDHFLEQSNREYDRRVVGFTDDAMQLLSNYSWPGNVRELRNDLEKLVIGARSGAVRLRAEELSPKFHEGRHSTPDVEQLLSLPVEQGTRGFLRLRIQKALETSGGRIQEAAEELGRTRQWLNKQIRELDLQGEVDALKEHN